MSCDRQGRFACTRCCFIQDVLVSEYTFIQHTSWFFFYLLFKSKCFTDSFIYLRMYYLPFFSISRYHHSLTNHTLTTLSPRVLCSQQIHFVAPCQQQRRAASTSLTPLFLRRQRGNTLAWCLAAADTKQHLLLTWLQPLYTDAPPHTADSILYTLTAHCTGCCCILYYSWFASAMHALREWGWGGRTIGVEKNHRRRMVRLDLHGWSYGLGR